MSLKARGPTAPSPTEYTSPTIAPVTPTRLQPSEGHPGVMIVGDHYCPDGGTWILLDREHLHHVPLSQRPLRPTNPIDQYEGTCSRNALPYVLTPEGRAAVARNYTPGTAAAHPAAHTPASPVPEPFQHRQTPSISESFANSTTSSTSEILPHRQLTSTSTRTSAPTHRPASSPKHPATSGSEIVLSTNDIIEIKRNATILEQKACHADIDDVKISISARGRSVTDSAVRGHFLAMAKDQYLKQLREVMARNEMQQANVGRQMREQGRIMEQGRGSQAVICGTQPPSDGDRLSGTDLTRYRQ